MRLFRLRGDSHLCLNRVSNAGFSLIPDIFHKIERDSKHMAASASASQPPIASEQTKVLTVHGDERLDPYFWLSDRTNPEVIAYLDAENSYTEAKTEHLESLQKALYDEMLDRIQETDLSVPYRYKGYYYYSRTEESKAYSIYCRKKGSLKATEEILLDQNILAKEKDFFDLGVFEVSPSQALLAYATDTEGDERYTLKILNLKTNNHFAESISDTCDAVWANDNETLFYLRLDEAHRPFQLWRHQLKASPDQDKLIYEEKDEAYYLSLGTTRSEAYILLSADSKITSEVRFVDANHPEEGFQVIHPRERGVEYSVAHHPGEGDDNSKENRFYIVTNDDAINFKLMVTPVSNPGKSNWQTVIPHREDVTLSDIDVFKNYLVLDEQQRGLADPSVCSSS